MSCAAVVSPTSAGTVPFETWAAERAERVEAAAQRMLPPADAVPQRLHEAMRYAVLGGGKRVRPLLAHAAGELAGAATQDVDRVACAIELIHAYSLIHDDMPCMDDDVLRRGKPTVHVEYDEATALLAGDALQTLAFQVLSEPPINAGPVVQLAMVTHLAVASGSRGMAGGQAIDLASVGVALTEDQLRQMHRLKTGALLQGSVLMGAVCGHAAPAAYQALSDYGAAMGLAFQVVDDILDVTADSATLGKTAGKDAAADKPTFVSLMGLTRAQAYADDVLARAHEALHRSGLRDTDTLHALADWVGRRDA